MTILQLNPTIPMHCPQGIGYAIAMIDYSQEHDILWIIAINETGEVWAVPNKDIRAIINISMGRNLATIDKLRDIHAQNKIK